MPKNTFTIGSIFYNSLLKRRFQTNNKKNTNPLLPIIAIEGFGGGGGPGGGRGNNLFILFITLVIGPRIIYDNLYQNKK